MKPMEISEVTVNYSRFLSKWQGIRWNYAYAGREKGQEITLGNFSVDNRYFYYFSYKTTVKPMIITNTDDQFDFTAIETIKLGQQTFGLYTKERFLVEKIINSPEFLINLEKIFPGRNNWLEFTDLNQVILVTDYDFADEKTMLELIANFIQIKEKL
jgi:hypothetical protein